MMIRFFRSSYAAQYIVLTVFNTLLFLPAMLQPETISAETALSPLSSLAPYLLSHFPYLTLGLSILLVLIQAYFINAIFSAHQLSVRVGVMGAFVYVILMGSVFSQQPGFTNYLLAALFVLAALHTLLLLYDAAKPDFLFFNAGLFVSLASLFYFPFALLLFWIWIGLFISRILQLRALLITIVGFITPYFFLLSGYYLTDQLDDQFTAYMAFYKSHSLTLETPSFMGWISISLVILLLFFSLNHVLTKATEKNISTRKKFRMLSWLYAFSIGLIAMGHSQYIAAALFSIPLTAYIAFYLSHAKKLFFPKLLLLLIILLAFAESIILFLS